MGQQSDEVRTVGVLRVCPQIVQALRRGGHGGRLAVPVRRGGGPIGGGQVQFDTVVQLAVGLLCPRRELVMGSRSEGGEMGQHLRLERGVVGDAQGAVR